MFPHTPHIETVMVFERIEYETAPDKSGKAAPAIPTGDDIVSTTSSASGVGTPIPAIEELPGIPRCVPYIYIDAQWPASC